MTDKMPTPRTDATTRRVTTASGATGLLQGKYEGPVIEYVDPDFARQLERELATAKEQLKASESTRTLLSSFVTHWQKFLFECATLLGCPDTNDDVKRAIQEMLEQLHRIDAEYRLVETEIRGVLKGNLKPSINDQSGKFDNPLVQAVYEQLRQKDEALRAANEDAENGWKWAQSRYRVNDVFPQDLEAHRARTGNKS